MQSLSRQSGDRLYYRIPGRGDDAVSAAVLFDIAEAREREVEALHRQLLAITDLAKRDPALAARRLETFLVDLEAGAERSDWAAQTR